MEKHQFWGAFFFFYGQRMPMLIFSKKHKDRNHRLTISINVNGQGNHRWVPPPYEIRLGLPSIPRSLYTAVVTKPPLITKPELKPNTAVRTARIVECVIYITPRLVEW